MRVNVRYFAVVRERVGREEESLELDDEAATVATVLEALGRRHAAVRELLRHLQVALNQEMTPHTARVHDGDEIALIPPVAGGSGPAGLYRLQEAPLQLDEAVRAVAGADAGGLVTFVGTVRRESRGRRVQRLEDEAYLEMAERKLRETGEELGKKHGARLAILHRTGMLEVGESAVIIAAAAPHRGEAFAACREAIERLKAEAPIWKKELGEDGEEWVGLGP